MNVKPNPITKIFAEDTTNKTKLTEAEKASGIVYKSPIVSDQLNGIQEDIYQTVAFMQQTGGLYNDSITYSEGQFCRIWWKTPDNPNRLCIAKCKQQSYAQPPITGASITTVNYIDTYNGGSVNSDYWEVTYENPVVSSEVKTLPLSEGENKVQLFTTSSFEYTWMYDKYYKYYAKGSFEASGTHKWLGDFTIKVIFSMEGYVDHNGGEYHYYDGLLPRFPMNIHIEKILTDLPDGWNVLDNLDTISDPYVIDFNFTPYSMGFEIFAYRSPFVPDDPKVHTNYEGSGYYVSGVDGNQKDTMVCVLTLQDSKQFTWTSLKTIIDESNFAINPVIFTEPTGLTKTNWGGQNSVKFPIIEGGLSDSDGTIGDIIMDGYGDLNGASLFYVRAKKGYIVFGEQGQYLFGNLVNLFYDNGEAYFPFSRLIFKYGSNFNLQRFLDTDLSFPRYKPPYINPVLVKNDHYYMRPVSSPGIDIGHTEKIDQQLSSLVNNDIYEVNGQLPGRLDVIDPKDKEKKEKNPFTPDEILRAKTKLNQSEKWLLPNIGGTYAPSSGSSGGTWTGGLGFWAPNTTGAFILENPTKHWIADGGNADNITFGISFKSIELFPNNTGISSRPPYMDFYFCIKAY